MIISQDGMYMEAQGSLVKTVCVMYMEAQGLLVKTVCDVFSFLTLNNWPPDRVSNASRFYLRAIASPLNS